ncbi:MAG: glycosyltransferase, partial [Nitrososphaerota archaeon]|nr:glycosyltransferase [Nitrososphaerota archaeon]
MLRISVITPTLNRRKFIKQALDSVSRQGYPELEHIVVDGGSTDGTVEFIENYSAENPHVKLLKSKASFSHQVNVGLRNSKGDVLVYLADDDLLADG